MKATAIKTIPVVQPLFCAICNKPMQAPYGSHRDNDGSCSRKCENLLVERMRNEINARFTSPSG